MLSDHERKTLTVLANMTTMNRFPTWPQLQVMTGRRQEVLQRTLESLEKKKAIEWDGRNLWSIKVAKDWRVLLDPSLHRYV